MILLMCPPPKPIQPFRCKAKRQDHDFPPQLTLSFPISHIFRSRLFDFLCWNKTQLRYYRSLLGPITWQLVRSALLRPHRKPKPVRHFYTDDLVCQMDLSQSSKPQQSFSNLKLRQSWNHPRVEKQYHGRLPKFADTASPASRPCSSMTS